MGQGLGYWCRFGLPVTLEPWVIPGKLFFENGTTADGQETSHGEHIHFKVAVSYNE